MQMIINTFIGYFFMGEYELKINFIYRLDGGAMNKWSKAGTYLRFNIWLQDVSGFVKQIIDLHGT